MSKDKKLKVINQTKRKKIDRILASTLAGVLCAGALAGGGYYAYKQIKDRDKTIADQKTTIGTLEEENKVSKAQIEKLTKDLSAKIDELTEKDKQIEAKDAIIAEKDADIADKQKTIAEKDADIADKQKTIDAKDKIIADKQSTIDEQITSINTLTSQKTSLLSAVTEIDNKINSTSDSVEIDNLQTRKTAILNQIDQLDSQIETLTTQKTKLENDVKTLQSDKAQLQNQVDTLTSDKTTLQNQVNTLTSEKTQLQQEIATLTTEKQNLQSQIDTLNTQLAEFEQYTLNIDQTNPVESITIEDTKLGTSATMSNVNITTLKLYSWQNATIKYKPSEEENKSIFATKNGVHSSQRFVVIKGSDYKGETVNISSIINNINPNLCKLYEHGTRNLIRNFNFTCSTYVTPFEDSYKKIKVEQTLGGIVSDLDAKLSPDTYDCVIGLPMSNKTYLSYVENMYLEYTRFASIEFSPIDFTKMPNFKCIQISQNHFLKEVKFAKDFDTSSFSTLKGLFVLNNLIETLDLSMFKTENVVDMSYMFEQNSKLKAVNITGFNTSNVNTSEVMFRSCPSLTEIKGLNSLTFENLTNAYSMFNGCSSLTVIDLSSFAPMNSFGCNGMFYQCSSLKKLNLSSLDFSKISSSGDMFTGVPTDCEILVKDESAKTWMNTNFPTMTNVKIKTAEAAA